MWLLSLYERWTKAKWHLLVPADAFFLSPPREERGLNHPKALLVVRASSTGVGGAPPQGRRQALGAALAAKGTEEDKVAGEKRRDQEVNKDEFKAAAELDAETSCCRSSSEEKLISSCLVTPAPM